MQETVLSKRRLICADGLVFWACQKAEWREDLVTEHTKQPEGHSSFLHTFSNFFASDRHGYPALYDSFVSDYTQRKLSCPDDILDAWKGLSNAFERRMCTTLHYGLPIGMFDWALLWRIEFGAIAPRDGFPSWSWVGWTGNVSYFPTDFVRVQSMLTEHTWIDYFVDVEEPNASIRLGELEGTEGFTPVRFAREWYRDYFGIITGEDLPSSRRDPLAQFSVNCTKTVPPNSWPLRRTGQLRFYTISAFFSWEAQYKQPN